MNDKTKIRRRTACATILAGGSLLLPSRALAQRGRRRTVRGRAPLSFQNSDFYDSDGAFNAEAAKEIYLEMLRRAHYPIPENPKEKMYAKDWGLGEFTNIGLGGFVWVDSQEHNYCALEMILLPGQMVPEHWHVADEAAGIGIKMESWHIRWGQTFAYGEGEPTANLAVTPPESQKEFITALHETPLGVGEVAGLTKHLEKHWQQAGPQGCILTEPSNYHSDHCMRYTDPNIEV